MAAPINTPSTETTLATLTRIGKVCAVLGGVILLTGDALGQALETLGRTSANYQTTPERIVSLLMLYGGIALVPGLIGLYLHHSDRAGRFGAVAALAAIVATASMIGSDWSEFYVLPTLSSLAPHLVNHPPTLLVIGFMINFALYSIGWVLFGASVIRARVYPRIAGIVLIVGMLLFLAQHHIGPMVWEMSIIVLGVSALRADRREAAEESGFERISLSA
jgi:hypothetical protein